MELGGEFRRNPSYREAVRSARQPELNGKGVQGGPVNAGTNIVNPADAALGRDSENPVVLAILDGDEFDTCFAGGRLPAEHPFAWHRVMAQPKADHGTFSTRWMQTRTYHLLHTGGFLRMATERGRIYWLAQNEAVHATPDWKIHFSISPRGFDEAIAGNSNSTASTASSSAQELWERDIGVAWDILAALFMERSCEAGMKARYTPWLEPDCQRGRELTVYVYTFSPEYDKGHVGGPMEGLSLPGEEHLHHLGYEHEALFTASFWKCFIQEAELRFMQAGLVSAGLADGDLALPGCRYASLRNEAYIPVENQAWKEGDPSSMRVQPAYPPNAAGWNAAGHDNPLEEAYNLLEADTERT